MLIDNNCLCYAGGQEGAGNNREGGPGFHRKSGCLPGEVGLKLSAEQ